MKTLLSLFLLILPSCNAVDIWKVDNLSPYNQNDISKRVISSEQRKDINSLKHKTDAFHIIREKADCIFAHDFIRNMHGELKIEWNEELAYEAEEWAMYLAYKDLPQLVHSDLEFDNGTRYGENLYFLQGVTNTGDKIAGCNFAVHSWYNEIHKYNYDHPGTAYASGHFTQLVWNETIHLGVGVTYVPRKKKTYIVARYVPPGNIRSMDEYKENVLKANPGLKPPSLKDLIKPGGRDPFKEISVSNFEIPHKNNKGEPACVNLMDCTYFKQRGDCDNALYKNFMRSKCHKACSGCEPGDPVDGGWTDWSVVEECAASCGSGQETSHRFCHNPHPQYGGKECEGIRSQTKSCNEQNCPGIGGETNEKTTTNQKPNPGPNPTTSTTTTSTTHNNKDCIDKSEHCQQYAKLGYCLEGPYTQWMYIECKLSCKSCGKKYLELQLINP